MTASRRLLEDDWSGELPLPRRGFRSKAACGLAILFYNVLGYFLLNRYPFEAYRTVPRLSIADDLPIIPWTIVAYLSVYVFVALAIFLQPDPRGLRRYLRSTLISFTATFLFFALIPTRMDREPLPGGSFWLWALELTRSVDNPHTCFPSLHIANCVLGVAATWGYPWRWWFLAWAAAIAASTLTTDQHLFWDIPSGVAMGLLGVAGERLLGDRGRIAARKKIGKSA